MKRNIKLLLSYLLYYTGLLSLKKFWNNFSGKRLTVLTFHRVVAQDKSNGLPTINISTENFDALMRFIQKHYKVISLSECLEHFRTKTNFAPNSLLLTFDDGYEGVLTEALPILRKYEFPSVIFIPTEVIEHGGGFWWDGLYDLLLQSGPDAPVPKLPVDPAVSSFTDRIVEIARMKSKTKKAAILDLIETLQDSNPEIRERVLASLFEQNGRQSIDSLHAGAVSWQQLREMQASGMAVGSHTVHHEFLTSISDARTESELTDSKDKLETNLDTHIESFSYPGGRYNEDTPKLVESAAYSCAFTSDAGINSLNDDRFRLKRINISDDNITTSGGIFSPAITALLLFSK